MIDVVGRRHHKEVYQQARRQRIPNAGEGILESARAASHPVVLLLEGAIDADANGVKPSLFQLHSKLWCEMVAAGKSRSHRPHVHRRDQVRQIPAQHGLAPIEGNEVGSHIQCLGDRILDNRALQYLSLSCGGTAMDAVVGAGFHDRYGELIGHGPPYHGPYLGG